MPSWSMEEAVVIYKEKLRMLCNKMDEMIVWSHIFIEKI